MERLNAIILGISEACCALLYNGTCVGTGWLAGDSSRVVSAGHLFSDGKDCNPLDPEKVNRGEITARFFCSTENGKGIVGTKEYRLKLICGAYRHAPLLDYCILEPAEPIGIPGLPVADRVSYDGRFFSAGCGKTLNTLSDAKGEIIGIIPFPDGIPILKLSSDQSSEAGYSGAPIYSENAGGVIGIQSEITRNDSGAESKTVLAFPVSYLIDRKYLTPCGGGSGFPGKPDAGTEDDQLKQQAGFYTTSDHYLGRDELVDRIVSEMEKPKPSVIVVHGVAGIGKTEVCKAAYQKIREKDTSFDMPFVDLIGVDHISEFLERIARAFRISLADVPMEKTNRFLQDQLRFQIRSREGRVFAYLDNFEDAWNQMDEEQQKELTKQISTLSRQSGLRFLISSQVKLPGFDVIPVGPLDGDPDLSGISREDFYKLDRVRLFVKVLSREPDAREFSALKKLMIETGGHPLSIVLSANYGRNVATLETLRRRWDRVTVYLPADPETHESLGKALAMSWNAVKKNRAAALRWAIHSLSIRPLETEEMDAIARKLPEPVSSGKWEEGEAQLNTYGLVSQNEKRKETMLLAVKKAFACLSPETEALLREALSAWIAWIGNILKNGENYSLGDRLDWHHRALEWLPECFWLAEYCADRQLNEDLALLLEHAENYYNFDTAQSLLLLGTLIDKTPDSFPMKGTFYRCRGDLLRRLNKTDDARKAYEDAEKLYSRCRNNRGLAQVYYARGVLIEKKQRSEKQSAEFKEAETLFIEAEKLFRELGDYDSLGYLHLSLGILYEKQGQKHYPEAEAEYAEAERIFDGINDRLGTAHMYQTLGIYMTRKKDSEKALEYFTEAEDIFRKEKDRYSLACVLLNKGIVLQSRPEPGWKEAYACFTEASGIFRTEQDQVHGCRTLIRLAECSRAVEDDQAAERYIEQAQRLMNEIPADRQKQLKREMEKAAAI